ncbi:NAD(P)-dependent oxidoreductase [Xanthobacter tagetidis]|uniref:NAD(P)-dependent oxidoreductase n=1 Tax=Xanthobacter tagetidis TaxID=60216 RepID=A0A3L7A329_9HYPH|nr:NAD(P)-dependent oxidoreductase [Xanthobacter tagetidis]MBB6309937.1 3-hydroxyisobutyrate dehydrogenase [Xanthobacter tagetidis]RLP74649.1 NAD(P)-dependent oxidoreductase [Xanthobacter tagetidis]
MSVASDSLPKVAMIGLGMMGLPMATCLLKAGFPVVGADLSASARAAFAAAGGAAFEQARDAVAGADVVITMLPDGRIVRDALLGDGGIAAVLPAGTLVLDMSSSAPIGTVRLGAELAALELRFVDAPVSGGVRRAVDGTLAIMAGGSAADVEAARPVLAAMGRSVFATGPLGSGHAMKALNNYVSAAGLLASCEALAIAEAFGIAPETVVDVLNASTGRNNSTETKLKPFVLSGTFGSGFALALMAKDLRTAADLAAEVGIEEGLIECSARKWEQARAGLRPGADHTEISSFVGTRHKAR